MMLRRLFRRKLPLGTIDQRLDRLAVLDDPAAKAAEIEQLRSLLAVFHDAAGDAAQRAVAGMEIRLSGQLQSQFGATNEMISQAVSHARGAEEGTTGLQSQVSALEGRFSDLGEALNERLDGHDAELKQLHVGQDALKDQVSELNGRHETQIAEVTRQLEEALSESRQDRADLRARVEQLERERGGR
jgi:chromosome segregation ATPase